MAEQTYRSDKSQWRWAFIEFTLMGFVIMVFKNIFELQPRDSTAKIYAELLIFLFASASSVFIWRRRVVPMEMALRSTEKKRLELEHEFQNYRNSIAPHAANILQEVERQFATWQFTAAEKEIAILLLKGLSLKDIAIARGVSEKTVKQQNLNIYQKSGLAGRAELSAFFMEDLLTDQSSLSR